MTMTFNIDARHLELTQPIKEYAEKKMERIEKICKNRVTSIHIVLSVEKLDQIAEAEFKIAGDKNVIFAEAVSHDLYQSIDKLEDKLYAQVSKYHDKLIDHEQ